MKSLFVILLPSAFILVLFAVCPTFVFAQPRGDEREVIHRRVDELRRRVLEIDEQIARDGSSESKLYAERGKLYREVYLSLYDGSFISHFYGDKSADLSANFLTTKAIADFSKALKLSASPSAELYQFRAEMYEARWKDFVFGFKWEEERRKLEVVEWRDFIEPHFRRNELVVFGKFVGNSDFQAALNDYERVLRLGVEPKAADKIHQETARLYLERALNISWGLRYNREIAVVSQKNVYKYLLFDDIKLGIQHIEQSHPNNDYRQDYALESSWFKVSHLTPMYANYFKSQTADDFGNSRTAFDAINEAERYFRQSEKNVTWDYFGCQLYTFRSRLNSKWGNFDRALADANYAASATGELLCGGAYLARGDAYFGKGELQKAIADYTRQLSLNSSFVSAEEVYKKRGIARLKTGETEKAIKDFQQVSGFWLTSLEGYLLGARAFRLLGNEESAINDEKAAVNVRQLYNLGALKSIVYGKIRIPDSLPTILIDYKQVELELVYLDGTTDRWSPRVDEKGRFKLYDIKPKQFYLTARYDAQVNGKVIRYSGRTKTMTIGDRILGPMTIDLKQSTETSILK